MNQINFQPKRIAGIDGLRAVAVLAVIAYHLNYAFFRGGFVGVDIFFVISGYVVCSSLLRDSSTGFLPFIGAFYVRRLLRIYPALIVLLLFSGLLATLFIPPAYLNANHAATGMWAFYGLGNYALIFFKNSYFSPNNDYNPYAHTWSLGVEEQFYVLFPLIMFGILWARQKPALTRQFVSLVLPLLLLISLGYSIYETKAQHDAAYFLLPSRFWELAAGALLCLAHQQKRFLPTSPSQAATVTSLGLVTLALSITLVEPIHFPFPLAIPPVLGTLLCISGVVSISASGIAFRFLTLPPVVYLGRISYSLYLYHWLIIVMLRWTIGLEGLLSNLLAIGLTFLFAAASYHFIETSSFLRHSALQKRKLATIAVGICIIFSSHYFFKILGGARLQNRLSQSTVIKNRTDWYPHHNETTVSQSQDSTKHWHARQLFCIGDSHAYTYGGMLRMLQVEDGVSVHIDSLPGQFFGSLVFPLNSVVKERQEKALESLRKSSRPGDVVLLASLRVKRLCDHTGYEGFPDTSVVTNTTTDADRELAVRQAKELVQQLLDLELHVIFNAPTPVFRASPFRGADWFNHMNPVNSPGFTIDYQFMQQHRAQAMQSLQELQQSFPTIQIWDPLPVFRSGTICSAFEGSPPNAKPLFFDGDHLSDYGGRKLYPSFKLLLEKLWN